MYVFASNYPIVLQIPRIYAEYINRCDWSLCLFSSTWLHTLTRQTSVCTPQRLLQFVFSPSVGNAKIEGLLPSLHMSGMQYNIALSIFFIPYVLAGKLNLSILYLFH